MYIFVFIFYVPGPEQLEIKRYLFSADHRKHSGGESKHDTYIHTYILKSFPRVK